MQWSSLKVALLVLLPACTAGSRGGPQETLRRYVQAVENDSPGDAYQLLDESVRRQMTPTEFASRWSRLRPELQAQAVQLKEAIARPIKAHAQVSYPGGRATLAYSDDRWRIEEAVTLSGGAATPTDALRAFVRAVESRNFEAVMRLLSRSARENLERDIVDRISKLKQALNQEIEVTGGRARLQYDPRFKIELIQEDGEWRILDLD